MRRDLLRANRGLGLLLAVVLGLAAVAVYFMHRSGRHQERAERAEQEATERLWRVSLARARAERANPEAGHRAAALDAIRSATAIRPSVELRNEAIAALRLPDFEPETSWTLKPNARGFCFDPELECYGVRYDARTISLFRLSDNSHVRDYPAPAEVPPEAVAADFMFSSTGRYLAVRYENGPIVLLERDTGRMACSLGLDPLTARCSWPPSFTADDSLLCTTMSGSAGTWLLYDIAKREPRRPAAMPSKITVGDGVSQVAVSPRGDLLSWHDGVHVRILDAVSGTVKHDITAPTAVKTLDWDRQGDRLVFGCGNATLFLLEAASGRVLQLGGRTVQPWVQRFNEDGSLLLTSGLDGVTSLWDVASASLLCRSNEGRGVAISRSGDRIAWVIPRQKVGVWRVTRAADDSLLQGRHSAGATMLQHDFSFDGRRAVWSPPTWMRAQGVELCDTTENRQAFLHTGRKTAVGFLTGTDRLWLTTPNAITLHDWPDLARPLPPNGLPEAGRLTLPPGHEPVMAAFTADARNAAVACAGGQLLVIPATGSGAPVAMEQGVRFTADAPGPGGLSGSGALAISPDGSWVVAGRDTPGSDPTIWDARTGRLVARLPAPAAHVCFSPDGRHLLTVGIRRLQLWAVGTWRERWSRERPASLAGFLGSAAFAGDGTTLAWSSDLDVVEITDSASGTALASIELPRLYPITGLRFSSDGTSLFAAGPEGRAQLIDLGSLRRRHLAPLGLDWPFPAAAAAAANPAPPGGTGTWLPIALGLAAVTGASLLGIMLFRRQSRLAGEFLEAARLASLKERELHAERELGELKSRFVTTVSHEFRTPLGITMSAVELLRHYDDRLPREDKVQLLDDIHGATRNMAELMEQVLVLGRVDAGRLAFKPAPLDIEGFMRRLTDESLSATNRRSPIECRCDNDLSGASADEALLRHIFTNLLHNGVKYSPAGSPVHFTARREGSCAVFTVTDHGIGIPEDDLPRLFEAFHRGTNVGDIPGTGLGLVITKRCAELHEGSIAVQSTPGAGTTFTVRITAWP